MARWLAELTDSDTGQVAGRLADGLTDLRDRVVL